VASLAKERAAWEKLQAQYNATENVLDELRADVSFKYGPGGEHWASTGETNKLRKLRDRMSRIGDRMFAILERVSPRSWGQGAPAWWIYSKLSFDDVIRPKGERLSVTPPGAYGQTEAEREAFVARGNPTDPRYVDLMRQGFMKGPKRQAKPKAFVPHVACERCQDWHAPGKHIATCAVCDTKRAGGRVCGRCGSRAIKPRNPRKWIQSAIKHPGALRRQLGIPEGKRIPVAALHRAAKAPGKLGKRARLAMTLRGMRNPKAPPPKFNVGTDVAMVYASPPHILADDRGYIVDREKLGRGGAAYYRYRVQTHRGPAVWVYEDAIARDHGASYAGNPRGRRNPPGPRRTVAEEKAQLRKYLQHRRELSDPDKRVLPFQQGEWADFSKLAKKYKYDPDFEGEYLNPRRKAPLARVGPRYAKGLRFGAAVHIGATTKSGQKLPGTWIVVKRQGQRLVVMHPKTRALASVPRSKVTLANPQPSAAEVERAARAYKDFHWGTKPTKQVRVKVPRPSGKLWAIGKLHSAAYTTTKGREGRHTWEHEFGEGGGKKPTLATDGKRLFVIGGTYKIKPEGITG
jgi:hypothetical protein